jgi:hypothetical protein
LGAARHPIAASANGVAVAYIETTSGDVAVKVAALDVHGNPVASPATLAAGAQAQREAIR